MMKEKIKIIDFYTCERCKNNTLNSKGTMIPCPRGSCEARISGTITKTITTEINRELTDEQIKWNEENGR